jgi:FkbM family methyltransferase
MEDALQHLRRVGLKPSTIIDVGVAFGTPELYRVFPEPTYLLIEPLAEFEPNLKALLSTQIRGSYELAAAGAAPGVINMALRGEASSAYRDIDRSNAAAQTRQVPVTTLDDLCEQRALTGPYLVKVDVQGAELEVLAGAKTTLIETEVVILEVSLFQLSEGIPQFADVVQTMDGYGFATYDLFEGLARPADGALAQIDMAFVKTAGRLRQYQGFRDRKDT